jgi:hypothetical protein
MTRIFFLALTLLLLGSTPRKNINDKKYLNYLTAVQNRSTFNYFAVITVKNLNSGEVKEICTKGNFISGAIHIELNVGYDEIGDQKVLDFAKSKKDRCFEFKNEKALRNLSFFDYDSKLIDKIHTDYNIDKVAQYIDKDKEFVLRLQADEMKAFAHILFNKGYMTGENSCMGGFLEYVEMNKQD